MGNIVIYFISFPIIVLLCFLTHILFEPITNINGADFVRLLLSNFDILTNKRDHEDSFLETSVWCQSDTDGHKLCSFKNLWYLPLEKQFIFVLTKDSIVSGIKSKDDLKTLQLSSVSNHNKFIMNIAIVTSSDIILKKEIIYKKSSYIFWRFKDDNICHAIHDDLLPLYTTYSHLCSGNIDKCVSNFQLAFIDEGRSSLFSQFYSVFSNSEPILLNDLNKESMICFHEARTGLIRSSVWFQYGFDGVQGPTNNTELNGGMIKQFANYVSNKLVKQQCRTSKNFKAGIVFSRKINRKILNEDFVLNALNGTFQYIFPIHKTKIFLIDLSVNNTETILSTLACSKFVVGMHGAELILSIFLPVGSVVIELFPYGIEPYNVSPVKALSNLSGKWFTYRSWKNTNETNTVAHPDAHALMGGISHLPLDTQYHIKQTIPVPAVKCCHNPAYLYRMFQDTHIGTDFITILEEALINQKQTSKDIEETQVNSMISQWWFPATVSNISCYFNSDLVITWNPSINIKNRSATYEVTVTAGHTQMEFTTNKPELKIENLSLPPAESSIHIWVKCAIPELAVESADIYAICTTSRIFNGK